MPLDLSRQRLEIWRSIYQTSRNIKVANALVRNRGDVIRFPGEDLWETILTTFYPMEKFSSVFGAIDCTHNPI